VTARLSWASEVGRVRFANEDSFLVEALAGTRAAGDVAELGPGGLALAVFDGLGGADAGEVASREAARAVSAGLLSGEASPSSAALAEKLAGVISGASAALYEASRQNPEHRGMGTTATVAVVRGSDLVIGHVGDSRAYVLRGETLSQVTRDQTLVNQMIDEGRLLAGDAAKHPDRHIVMQALGGAAPVKVATYRVPLERGDVLMLCTDGLTEHLGDEEIRGVLVTAASPQEAVQTLVGAALDAGGRDNITVIVAAFDGDGLPARGDVGWICRAEDDQRLELGADDPLAQAGEDLKDKAAQAAAAAKAKLEAELSSSFNVSTSDLAKAEAQAASVITSPSPNSVKELVTTTAGSILKTPALSAAISDESKALVGGYLGAAQSAVSYVNFGSLAAAAQQSPNALAAEVAMQAIDVAVGAAGAAAAAAGVAATAGVGAAVVAVWGLFRAVMSSAASAAQERAREAQSIIDERKRVRYERDLSRMTPNPSGLDGKVVPADIFAWQRFIRPYFTPTALYRPLIGDALIKVTEAGLDRPDEQPANGISFSTYRPLPPKHYQAYVDQLRGDYKDPRLGVPEATRRVMRMVRRGIESQRAVKGSDGGQLLWSIYADLLVSLFDNGHLSEQSLDSAIHYKWDSALSKIDVEHDIVRPSPATPAIVELVRRRRTALAPIYAQDLTARAETLAMLKKLTQIAALKSLGQKFFTAEQLAGLPPEALKALDAKARPTFKGLVVKREESGLDAGEVAMKAGLVLGAISFGGALAWAASKARAN